MAGELAFLELGVEDAEKGRAFYEGLFGFGAGAIVQVIVQLAPTLRDDAGRTMHPGAVGGLLTGIALMFATGLLVSV